MNKKGIFVPLLAVISVILLISTAVVISISSQDLQSEIGPGLGFQATSLFKMYDEGQRFEFYMQQATKLAEHTAEVTVERNGGYPAENNCRKVTKSIADTLPYVIINSCDSFDPANAYKTQTLIDVQAYAQNYISVYPNRVMYDVFSGKTVSASKQLSDIYKTAKVTENIVVTLHPDGPRGMLDQDTTYDLTFPVETEPFNTQPYLWLYSKLTTCTSLETCQASLPDAETFITDNTLFIDYNGIRMAYQQAPLPPQAESSLFSA